jgi:hypothetical protein
MQQRTGNDAVVMKIQELHRLVLSLVSFSVVEGSAISIPLINGYIELLMDTMRRNTKTTGDLESMKPKIKGLSEKESAEYDIHIRILGSTFVRLSTCRVYIDKKLYSTMRFYMTYLSDSRQQERPNKRNE